MKSDRTTKPAENSNRKKKKELNKTEKEITNTAYVFSYNASFDFN